MAAARLRSRCKRGTSMPSVLAVFRLTTSSYFVRSPYRKLRRLLAFEDAIDIPGGAPIQINSIGSIGDQAAASNKVAEGVDRGKTVPGCQRDDEIAMKK